MKLSIFKKFIFVLFIVSIPVAFTSCAKNNKHVVETGHIKDTNGSKDFSLEIITEEDIINKSVPCLESGKKSININNNAKLSVKMLTGVDRVKSYNLTKRGATFHITPEVKSGNLGVYICTDKEILEEVEVNNGEQIVKIPATKDKVYLTIGGESASFQLKYSVKFDSPDKDGSDKSDNSEDFDKFDDFDDFDSFGFNNLPGFDDFPDFDDFPGFGDFGDFPDFDDFDNFPDFGNDLDEPDDPMENDNPMDFGNGIHSFNI